MEWLKAILEKAEIKDGKLDVDAVMNAAQKEFPKHAVPKDDFNNKVNYYIFKYIFVFEYFAMV